MIGYLKAKNTYYYSLSIILICILLISFNTTVKADNVTQINFSPFMKIVPFGSDFSIDIICTPNQPIKAYEFQLQFDPNYLEVLSVSEGDIFEGYPTYFNPGVINNNQGVITELYGLILGPGSVSNSGTLVSVTFHSKFKVGLSILSLANVGITNEVGYISIKTQNAAITVYDPASSHVITSIDPANKSQNVALSISEISVAIYDLDSDTFDWMIYSSPNIGNNSGTYSYDGIKTCSISGLVYSTTYKWYVHCKDLSSGKWTNRSYWFRTVNKPSSGGGGGNNDIPPSENNPPGQPIKPIGSTSIEVGGVYSYFSSTKDNDEDLIRLKFDWGDGSHSNWSDYITSNTTVEMNHYWDNTSNYNIRVIAQDQQGENSTWSEPLEIIVSQINISDDNKLNNNNSSIAEFLDIDNITYSLIDLDNNGKIDVFNNQMTNINSSFNYLDDNNILIDLDGDGNWDYIYNFEQKILSSYSSISEESKSKTSIINPWFLIIISLSILSVVIILFRSKLYLFILNLRVSILQLRLSPSNLIKRMAFWSNSSSLKHRHIYFFSNPEDKKHHITNKFKKLDIYKNFKTKLYHFKEIKPFSEYFNISGVDSDYNDDYSRMTPHPLSSLSKKIDDKDLLHDKVLSKIEKIYGNYEENFINSRIFDIESRVDRLFIDKLLLDKNLDLD